ncbi:metabolite traffic protein EboE [Fodinibius sediminis]|uniref:Xylose isomerase-like TIM barrel n=1 Tax=Fodinibius sediminis TaxID=1214077 RepID=A0A521DPM0_9BACT|nr:metabolite traffic protein EboE [Fodinibius sediminis]SMO72870.1 hypothetical protein SAMN06265218_11152 [Fodinibius sediminis]
MQLKNYPSYHITYCTNIHPGEQWNDVFEQLKTHVPELKRRLSPDRDFGIGLRLSARAARQLQDAHLEEFKQWLNQRQCYVFTMNGFPYGDFHHQRVKDLVYAPDWRTEERLNYTINLAHILAELLPEGMDGGISTSPVSYKYWLQQPSLKEQACRKGSKNLARVAWALAKIREESGKILHVDIEPEPDCLIENTPETIDFFNRWLLPIGSTFLENSCGISLEEAETILRDHVRLCYDTCHFALEYENPRQALRQFEEAGIKIGKTQVSAALKAVLPETTVGRRQIRDELRKFVESTYLHQVIERREDGSFRQYRDLDQALPHIFDEQAREWRIHYHVPIFVDSFEQLNATQRDITQSLEVLKATGQCRHFEIETYTWEILPEELKKDSLESIAREFEWVIAAFGDH